MDGYLDKIDVILFIKIYLNTLWYYTCSFSLLSLNLFIKFGVYLLNLIFIYHIWYSVCIQRDNCLLFYIISISTKASDK